MFIIDTGIQVGHVEFHQGNVFQAYTTRGLIPTGNVDSNGHGTHVAGTVAGETTGVAPGAEVHAVKACDADGRCSLSDLIDGVTWVCGQEHRRLQHVTESSVKVKVQHWQFASCKWSKTFPEHLFWENIFKQPILG